MPWELIYTSPAERDLRKIPEYDRERIIHALDNLAINPQLSDFTKLTGTKNKWRIRVGRWRATIELDSRTGTMKVLRILARKDAY